MTTVHQTTPRNLAIDAFRGLTIAGMILVNLPGSWSQLYPAVAHAKWHGWTPTDFVFPFFLFAIGLSMPFSFGKRQAGGDTSPLWQHILRRSGIIFAIGMFLNAFPKFQWEGLRIPGVLQRIAMAYLLAAFISIKLSWRFIFWSGILILLLYWWMMTGVYVPGYGIGMLTPEGNIGAYIDRLLLKGHLYKPTWDPEGLFGTLPAAVNILGGVLVGLFLRSKRDPKDMAGWLFVAGWGLIFLGIIWGIWFPINKKLWTSSYVLFTTGCAMQLLGGCQWLLQVKGWQKPFRPALIFGSNAIALYVLHILYIKVIRILIRFPQGEGKSISLYHWMYQQLFASWAGPLNGSLYFAFAHVFLWYLVAWGLYKKGWFLKV